MRIDLEMFARVFQGSLWALVTLLYISPSSCPPFSPIPHSPDPTNYPSGAFLHFRSLSSMFAWAAHVFSLTVVFIICSIIVHDTERLTAAGIGRSHM